MGRKELSPYVPDRWIRELNRRYPSIWTDLRKGYADPNRILRPGSGGRELIEKGDQAEADLVAENIIDEVGGVGDVVLADGIEVLEDVVTADAEQGTDNVAVAGTNACKTVDACTTEKVHEKGLDSVITMMGDTDGLGTDILA